LEELCLLVGGGTHLAVVLVDKRLTDPAYYEWCLAAAAGHWRHHGDESLDGQTTPRAGSDCGAASAADGGAAGSASSSPSRSVGSAGAGGAAGFGGRRGERTWHEYFAGVQSGNVGRAEGRTWQEYFGTYYMSLAPTTGAKGEGKGADGPGGAPGGEQQPRPVSLQQQAAAANGWSAYYTWWLSQGAAAGSGQQQQQQLQEAAEQLQQAAEQQPEEMQTDPPQQEAAAAVAAFVQPPPPSVTHPYLSGYAGHYLLLTGFDPATQHFWVQDPAKQSGPSLLAADLLEAGRKAFGTDEDLLLIEVPARHAAM
jgi:hypothetical protein